jgi:hypothetical protein
MAREGSAFQSDLGSDQGSIDSPVDANIQNSRNASTIFERRDSPCALRSPNGPRTASPGETRVMTTDARVLVTGGRMRRKNASKRTNDFVVTKSGDN